MVEGISVKFLSLGIGYFVVLLFQLRVYVKPAAIAVFPVFHVLVILLFAFRSFAFMLAVSYSDGNDVKVRAVCPSCAVAVQVGSCRLASGVRCVSARRLCSFFQLWCSRRFATRAWLLVLLFFVACHSTPSSTCPTQSLSGHSTTSVE